MTPGPRQQGPAGSNSTSRATLAFANYRLTPQAVIITHTETPRALRGRGIASELVKGALELIRADGHKVIAGCGFVVTISQASESATRADPEYADLIPDASLHAWTHGPQTILIDMSGRPSILHSSTSPFTTGPTFSGVPE